MAAANLCLRGENDLKYLTFKTAIGICGLMWSDLGIKRVALPGSEAEDPLRVLRADGGDCLVEEQSAPEFVADAARRLRAWLSGAQGDISGVPLDLTSCTRFARAVYATLRLVPPGEVVTYGELARRAGHRNAARAVGRALARNPLPLLIPCHRVVGRGYMANRLFATDPGTESDSGLGGYSGAGGVATKRLFLAIDDCRVSSGALQLGGDTETEGFRESRT